MTAPQGGGAARPDLLLTRLRQYVSIQLADQIEADIQDSLWLAAHDAEVAARAVEGAVARLRRLAEDEVAPLRPGQWRLVADLVQESGRIERQEATR